MRICLHFDEISRGEGELRGKSAVCARGRGSRGKFALSCIFELKRRFLLDYRRKSTFLAGKAADLDLPKIPLKMRYYRNFEVKRRILLDFREKSTFLAGKAADLDLPKIPQKLRGFSHF